MRRSFEIFPGAFAWATILLLIFLSWAKPLWVAVFIILFDVYWLLKTVYLSFHIRATFMQMRRNLRTDWLAKLKSGNGVPERKNVPSWKEIIHLVVLPMSRESYEVVWEGLASLSKAQYPRENIFVVLSVEERVGEEAQNIAAKIEEEFGNSFGGFLRTVHPDGLPGEAPGKGSNETWGAKQGVEELLSRRDISAERVLVSVFDVDTQVPVQYFGRLTHAFVSTPNPVRSIYQPVPLFINNVYEAPPLARIVAFSATFWQMMQQARPERLTTFSSQSIPLQVLLDIGFWDKDVVSEDSRIFWQSFLRYDGDFRVIPLEYPVHMDANVAPTFWGTMRNIYKQQRRWGWGVENMPYMFEGFIKNPRIPRGKKWYWSFQVIEGFHSWATNALMVFALGWLPVVLGGKEFGDLLLSHSLPQVTRLIITLSMVGIATSALLAVLLLPPRPSWFRRRHYALYFLEWIFLPVTLIVFGAFPGLEAQTRLMLGGRWRLGFWVTPKGRYTKYPGAGIPGGI